MTEPFSAQRAGSVSDGTFRRLRFRLVALLLILVAAGAVGGWLWQRQRTLPPAPPELDLEGSDPVVVRAIEKERQNVLHSPRSAEAWGRLGELLTAYNFRAEAVICLAQAEQLDPKEPRWPYHQGVLLLLDNPKAAIPKLRRAAELCGDSNLAPRLRLGDALLSLGQHDEAEESFREVRQSDPGNARAALGLGRIAFARKQWPQAQTYLEAAATDRHSVRQAMLVLAEVHQQKGDNEAAAELFRRVERLPPDPPWPDKYIEEVQRRHLGKRVRLNQANQLFERGDANKAIEQLNDVAKDYPDAPEVWFALGQCLHASRAYPAAEQAMRKVVELAPGYAEAHNYLGAARLRQGKFADAETALRKAIDIKPDFALAYVNLGRCFVQQKDPAGAIEAYRNAIRSKPDFVPARLELAELLHQEHRDAEALEEIRQALQLNPGDERAKELRKKMDPSK